MPALDVLVEAEQLVSSTGAGVVLPVELVCVSMDVNYLTRLPVFVLLCRWTLDGLILFLAVKRGYSGEKKTHPNV